MVAYDDDKDAFAAEYVLGTLSASERDQAEAMLAIDPNFEAAVRQWERRLGELNVMVEAVEPPPQVWDKIKLDMHPGLAASAVHEEAEIVLPRLDDAAPHVPEEPHDVREIGEIEAPLGPDGVLAQGTEIAPEGELEPAAEAAADHETGEGEQLPLSPLAALEASLFQHGAAAGEAGIEPEAGAAPTPRVEPRIERSTDMVILARRAARWRRMTAVVAAIAAVLAVYVALSYVAPNHIPAPLRPGGAKLAAHVTAPPPTRSQQDRLVAVLQQDPVAPAFLVTLDTRSHALTVRRVGATPDTGHSYQLWLLAKGSPNPRSLGVVGESEFTQRALPANYDVETLLTATYAVSLEPAGGSPSSAPTGPVLFTGTAVESLPSTPPRDTQPPPT